jgi:hypothetical protein
MKVNTIKLCWLVLAAAMGLVAPAVLPAAEEEQKIRVCLVPPVNLSSSADLDYPTIFFDALRAELVASGFEVVDREAVETAARALGYQAEDLLNAPKLFELSKRTQAGVAVGGYLQADRDDFILGLQGYQVSAGRNILSLIRRGQVGLGIYVLVNETAGAFTSSLRKRVEALPPGSVTVTTEKVVENVTQVDRMVEMGKRVEVTLLLDQDADVFLGDEALGRPKDGRILIQAQAASKIVLVVRKDGYHERRFVERIGDEPREIRLDALRLIAADELAFEYTSLQFVGAGLVWRHHWIPQSFFLKLSNYLYFQVGPTTNTNVIPHNDFSAAVGLRLSPTAAEWFRTGPLIGLGQVTTILPQFEIGPRVMVDFYAQGGWWFEFDFNWLKFYTEMGVKYGLYVWGGHLLTNHLSATFLRIPQITLGLIWKQW